MRKRFRLVGAGDKKGSALYIAKKELRKHILSERFFFFMIFFTVLCMLVLSFIFSEFLMTGFSSYVEGQAGHITEVNIINMTVPTSYWGGFYGLVFRIPGFQYQFSKNLTYGVISRQDLFFNCIQTNATGGNEVYASTSQNINWGSLVPADLSSLDTSIGCNGIRDDCPSNTFNDNISINVGSTVIENIPATNTTRVFGEGNNTLFDVGALYDGSNFVFVTHIFDVETISNISGSSGSEIINVQMMLPVPDESSQVYYFFTDPNDECVDAELDKVLVGYIYGYAFDENNNTLENVSVSIAGNTTITGSDGYYNLSILVAPGTYNLVASKEGYEAYFSNASFAFGLPSVEKNITLEDKFTIDDLFSGGVVEANVYGIITSSSGSAIGNVSVYLGGNSTLSNSSGFYNITSLVNNGTYPIFYVKDNYDIEYQILDFSANSTYEVDVVMSEPKPETVTQGEAGARQKSHEFDEEIIDSVQDYWISTKEINRKLMKNTYIEEIIGIYNSRSDLLSLDFELSDSLVDFVELDQESMDLSAKNFSELKVTIYGIPDPGVYYGHLNISGDIRQDIPITIEIVDRKYPIELLLMQLNIFNPLVRPGEYLKYKTSLQNLLRDQEYEVYLDVKAISLENPNITLEDSFETRISSLDSSIRELEIPDNFSDGDYVLEVRAKYLNFFSTSTASFIVQRPFYLYSFFGIPIWMMLIIISFFAFAGTGYLMYKRVQAKKKRYSISVDYATLPTKDSTRAVRVGNIAESKTPAYYEIDKLTVHTIVSGATGMGKSISAQVLIEECLKQNVCVIVFDPTAQWSGMLRKCNDKKMLGFYSKFGLKPKDAQAFKGNVRMIVNSRQKLDINKYFAPGQIQIFSMNRLTPGEIDIFVANVIKQIFRSDPQEAAELKILLVFDEVHRLLPKFGGSGKGFLQIERGCREFRKWGLGIMLISQVMKDFVGEIKANINTELQARTLDEGDLNRIKTKYGEGFLKSLVKAEIGVIMFQNSSYNKGRPYFINFRPILHSTKRLTDEELEKYNQYNDKVDDIEFSIDKLTEEKVDTFDLKMELKLVKDKIMTGSFSVVDVYLEGLVPRVQKEWDKIGKSLPKREIELVSDEEMEAEDKKAEAEKKKADSNDSKGDGAKEEEKPAEGGDKKEEQDKESEGGEEKKEGEDSSESSKKEEAGGEEIKEEEKNKEEEKKE